MDGWGIKYCLLAAEADKEKEDNNDNNMVIHPSVYIIILFYSASVRHSKDVESRLPRRPGAHRISYNSFFGVQQRSRARYYKCVYVQIKTTGREENVDVSDILFIDCYIADIFINL